MFLGILACRAHPLVEASCEGFQLLLKPSVLSLYLARVPHSPVVVTPGVPTRSQSHVSQNDLCGMWVRAAVKAEHCSSCKARCSSDDHAERLLGCQLQEGVGALCAPEQLLLPCNPGELLLQRGAAPGAVSCVPLHSRHPAAGGHHCMKQASWPQHHSSLAMEAHLRMLELLQLASHCSSHTGEASFISHTAACMPPCSRKAVLRPAAQSAAAPISGSDGLC